MRISEIQHAWGQAIAQTERLIAAKGRNFDALAISLLKGHKRLASDASNWSSVSFADVTCELSERNAGRLSVGAVMGVNKLLGMIPMKDHVRADDLSRYKVVPPDAFAYNPMRLNIGSLAKNTRAREVLVSPDYVAFAALEDRLDPRYFDHLRRSPIWSNFVTAAGTGSVRVRIYYEHLAALSFHLPALSIQKRLADIMDDAGREIDLLKQELAALQKQKRGLMQKLLTGEWRVPLVPLRDSEVDALAKRAAEAAE